VCSWWKIEGIELPYLHLIIARHELDDDGKQDEDHARQANEAGSGQSGDVLVETEGHHHAHVDEEDHAQSDGAHGTAPGGEEADQNLRQRIAHHHVVGNHG